jgi:hypothetical protein
VSGFVASSAASTILPAEEVSRLPRTGTGAALTAVMLLASVSGVMPQRGEVDLTVDAPASLAPAADRVRRVDRQPLAEALGRAGLTFPPQIHVTLIAEDDLRARATPEWIVGLASGRHDIAIFPERIGSYPYDSLESVVWHEVVHLALSTQAGDRPLPRWFHEGVAMSIEQGWGVTSQLQLLLAAGGSAGLADLERFFNSETQPETATAYLLAAALVSDVAQRHGAAVPGAIVDRVARGAVFAEAFAAETGETPDEAAARAWGVYRRWTSWIPVVTSAISLWIGILVLAVVAFLATLRKRWRRRRQWDREELGPRDTLL